MQAEPSSAKPSAGDVSDLRQAGASTTFRPFCSKRCADVDLNRWLSGVYAVPGARRKRTRTAARRQSAGSDERQRPHVMMRAQIPCGLPAPFWTARQAASITPALAYARRPAGLGAQVAQLVEHVTENHGVGGSIPPLGTSCPWFDS